MDLQKIARDNRYDFCRCVLVFSVVLGHTITALQAGGGTDVIGLHVFIRTFDMPMFAFISGYFLYSSCRKRDWKENIINKLTTILFPLILWLFIYNLIEGTFMIGRFWFLWSILMCNCLIIVTDSLFQNRIVRNTVFVFLILLLHTTIRDSFHVGFLLFPTIAGFLFHENENAVQNKSVLIQAGAVILFVLCLLMWKPEYSVWNLGCNIIRADYGYAITHMLLRGIIGLSGTFAMLWLLSFPYEWLTKVAGCHKFIKTIFDGTLSAGRSSLAIYILQTLLVEHYGASAIVLIVRYLGFNPFTNNELLLAFVYAPLISVDSISVMTQMVKILDKIPYVGKYLFGFTLKLRG